MRIVITSDTHYHSVWEQVLKNFVAEIADLKPDCLIVAGDLGNGAAGFRQMLTLLDVVNCPRLIVTGNHDLWCDPQELCYSEDLWREILPNITRFRGAIWLEGENWIKDGIGICGTNGWYDYTARDPSLGFTDVQYQEMKHRMMADGDFVNWKWTDIEFATMIGDAFEKRLAALEANSEVREILVVTHVPVFGALMTYLPDNTHWNTATAYFGNLTLGQRIQKYSKVRRVISGHTHTGKTTQIGQIESQVIPADYGHPAYLVFEL